MVPLLYLDTARLGRMSPAAQRATRDFAGLAGEVGGAIQFDRFLLHGLAACPAALQARYPGLAAWHGLAALRQSLGQLANVEPQLPVLLANRSAELMRFAAVLLRRSCRNILITDLGWPDCHRILSTECRRADRQVTTVALRKEMLQGRLNEDEVIERIKTQYVANDCDGLFLTAVNNLGIRLPVQRIYNAVKSSERIWFAVVDGAQDFRHVSSDLADDCCDLYLAGCHKWLGAYHPLGLAFYGRRRSRLMIETVLAECLEKWEIDDPLLRFVEGVCSGTKQNGGETVNLATLFSCQGAVSDSASIETIAGGSLAVRLQNAECVAERAAAAGWIPLQPHPTLRSGILLLQAERERTRRRSPEMLREAFYEHGTALTTYEDGVIRLSMPASPLRSDELELIIAALQDVA